MLNIYTNNKDGTTDRVIEYIRYLSGVEIQRLNNDNFYSDINIDLNNDNHVIQLSSEDGNTKCFNENDLGVGWYRRGSIGIKLPVSKIGLHHKVQNHLSEELNYLRDYIYHNSIDLGSRIKEINNNRLHNFVLARKCGLNIPSTKITTSKKELVEFWKKHDKIITKPIHNGYLSFEQDGTKYSCNGVEVVTNTHLENLSERFSPSLFQEYIEKEIEIRVFVIGAEMYAMAIFSQNDEQTKYDFRNYNREKPNRNVPFKIDDQLKVKLLSFMKEADLDTGSIDLILTPNGRYYFLEVNPTGQFQWLSRECNYNIEKRIAEHLIKEHETRKAASLLPTDGF